MNDAGIKGLGEYSKEEQEYRIKNYFKVKEIDNSYHKCEWDIKV